MDHRHPHLAAAADSALVVIDVQERLLPVIRDGARVEEEIVRAIRGADLLGVPVIVTEQYPQGLGRTTEAIRAAAAAAPVVEKTAFSAADEPAFLERLRALDRGTVALVGVEAHVCVLATAADLVARGFRVHVVADAVGARTSERREIGLARAAAAGAQVTCVESLLFEWARRAGTDRFRALSKLVR